MTKERRFSEKSSICLEQIELSRRALMVAGVGVAASAVLGAPAVVRAQSKRPIAVGFITSMSGAVSSLGIPYHQGIQAALEYNKSSVGADVRFIELDDASDPTNAAKNARKLVEEEKVDVLIGSAGSPAALAIATVAAETKTPLVSIANADPKGEPGAWAVTIPQPALLMVSGVVDHMKKNGVKTVGYIGFSDAWGDLVYNALISSAKEAGIEVTSNERYSRSDTSVTGQALKVVASRPDAVMTGGSGTPGALPYLALADRGYAGKLYGSPAIINPDFVRVGGASVENLIASTGPVVVFDQLPDGSPTKAISMAFASALERVVPGGKPNAFSAYSFDAWVVFMDAAKRAAEKTQPGTAEFRLALRDALVNSHDVVGTHGVYNYTPASRYGSDDRGRVLVQLLGGKWKLLA